MSKLSIKLVVMLLLFTVVLCAQEDTTYVTEEDTSFTDNVWEEEWDSEWHGDKDWSYGWDFSDEDKMPAISVNYGMANLTNKNVGFDFAKPNLLEFKIGYLDQDELGSYIVETEYSYLHLANISTQISKESNDVETDSWKFGLNWLKGYGYKIGNATITPYYQGSMNWTKLNTLDTPADTMEAYYLGRFNKTFRFGTASEGGIAIRPIPQIMINAGYERSAVFERHMFWKWAGSWLIEAGANILVDVFVDEIKESSPWAAPIVNFLLKNGLAYGVYELRKEKMNWPFDSEAPMMYDQVKFGVTFAF